MRNTKDEAYILLQKQFAQSIIDQLVKDGIKAEIAEIKKNNDCKYIAIRVGESNIKPQIKVDDLFIAYSNNEASMDEILSFIKESTKSVPDINIDNIFNLDNIKNKIFFKLINRKLNKERLQEIPYKEFLDFAIVYYIKEEENDNYFSILINNNTLNNWDITVDELNDIAYKNTTNFYEPHVTRLLNILPNYISESIEYDIPLLYASNSLHEYGSNVICYKGLLKEISDKYFDGKNYIIIPSSIDEVLMCPESDSLVDIDNLIAGVNESELEQSEVLSSHAYTYLRDEDKIIY